MSAWSLSSEKIAFSLPPNKWQNKTSTPIGREIHDRTWYGEIYMLKCLANHSHLHASTDILICSPLIFWRPSAINCIIAAIPVVLASKIRKPALLPEKCCASSYFKFCTKVAALWSKGYWIQSWQSFKTVFARHNFISFVKLLTNWDTRHSLKSVIVYLSIHAIASFKQANVTLFVESEESSGYAVVPFVNGRCHI